jgi:hypothetical protein
MSPETRAIPKRPAGVLLIAFVSILGGMLQLTFAALPLVIGLIGVSAGGVLLGTVGALVLFVVVATVVGAAAQIWFGTAALRLRPWAWKVGVLVSGFNALVAVVGTFAPGGLPSYLSLFLWGGVTFYLTTPSVRDAFGQAVAARDQARA